MMDIQIDVSTKHPSCGNQASGGWAGFMETEGLTKDTNKKHR